LSFLKKEQRGIVEEIQQKQREEEKKSYGKKRKSLLGIFLTVLPLILGALVVFLLYRYGKQVIRERDTHNEALIHEAAQAPSDADYSGALFEKLKNGEELRILLLGDGDLHSDSVSLTALKSKLEKDFGGKIVFEEAELPDNATSLSGYLILKGEGSGANLSSIPDLIVLSFGNYDEPYTFPYYYELLLRTVMENYSEASILPIISYKALSPEGYSKDNAMVLQNISSHYGIEPLNFAAVLAKQEEHPDSVMENQEEFQRFQEKYFVSAMISAMETVKKGEEASPINPILEEGRECIAIPKSLWKDYGTTALLLSEEELEKLSLKGRHGMLALSTALHAGENKGNLYVDGILEGNYSLTGESYLGILSRDVSMRQQCILNFETEEEKNNFQSLYFLSPIPLEKGLKNGTVLPLPEITAESSQEIPSETAVPEESSTGRQTQERNSDTGNKVEENTNTMEGSTEELIGIYDGDAHS